MKSTSLHKIFSNKWENTDFYFCGVNWWPFIRIQVSYQIELLNLRSIDDFQYEKFTGLKIKELSIGKKKYFLFLINRYRKLNRKCDVAVFTENSHISVPYKNTYINPFTFPFLKLFDKEKITYKIFQFWNKDDLYYDNDIILKVYKKNIIDEFNENTEFQAKLFLLIEDLKIIVSPQFDLYNFLTNLIIDNQAKYLSYLILFKKYKFKKVLAYCYYDSTVMSVFRAANELNIPTIEYQHSQVSSRHFAYSGWGNSIIHCGYFFPTMIWAWSKGDVKTLKSEFSVLSKFEVILGGNVVLPLFKVKVKDDDCLSKVKVLVTLEGTGLPKFIIDYLSQNQDYIFMIRLHPRYPQDNDVLIKLKNENPESIEIEIANSVSLYELLNEVDYLMASASGSVLEASAFGIPTIIYNEIGYITYKDQIESGTSFFIKNEHELNDILSRKLKPINNFDSILVDSTLIQKNIKLVFK